MKKWLALLCILISCNSVKRVGNSVMLDGSASTGSNGSAIIKYKWSCDNGCILETPNNAKTKAKLTKSKIKLQITDSRGMTADTTITVKRTF